MPKRYAREFCNRAALSLGPQLFVIEDDFD